MLIRKRKCTFRLTEHEYTEMCRKAATAGMKIEPFIRSLLDGCEIRPRPPDSYRDLAREIAAVGNNLNQIAHLANSTGYISPEQIERVTILRSQIWKLLQERV